ncbi:MAG: ABC transporter ATP-binding protein [Verrucomicrobia bacterium]|nr:ABC transporter ATP-binding protein [Verrucomicrobiota bacterium]
MHRYRPLLRYAGRQRRSFAAIAALAMLAALLAAAQPWPMKLAVDHVLNKLPLPARVSALLGGAEWLLSPPGLLAVAVGGGLLLFALNAAVEVLLVKRWTVAGRRMVYDLSEDVFARLQRRSLLVHSRNAVGDTMSRVTEDCWCLYRAVDAVFISPAQAVLTLGLTFFLMAQLDVALALVTMGVVPFMVAASFLVGRPLRAAARLKREIESRIQAHLQQTLTGIPVVQAFAQEGRERERFQQFADAAVRAQQYSTLLGSLNSLGAGLVTTLGTGLVLWLGAQHVLEGRLTLGGILVFIVYLTTLQSQVKTLANVHTALRNAQAGADRALEVLEAPPELPEPVSESRSGVSADRRQDRPCAQEMRRSAETPLRQSSLGIASEVRGHVRLENVVFGYQPDRPVLRGVTVEAKPGEIVALVGASGAGKTTLVNLIPRFFDPQQGRVLVDGREVREFRLRNLRERIAVVLQEPFLLPISVAENIAFGRPQATRVEIESAARAANAHEFIGRLPQGYDTVLGEHGATLSGGERQRLAIARALLKDAPILILDEPASALDVGTERLVFEALERLMAGRTVFLIAHRLSTVRHASRIVVLQDGVIAEEGTHDELLARGRLYARWNNLQFQPDAPSRNHLA